MRYRQRTLGSPYRDDGRSFEGNLQEEAGALASFDVSGAPGLRGRDGADGRAGEGRGESGTHGQAAGAAQPGQAAGSIQLSLRRSETAIQLSGELLLPDGRRQPIQDAISLQKLRAHREIELAARGGNGGHGGNGGRGGSGARGRDGSDATRTSDGGNGGSGGDGGDGGDGSSGAAGGDGGVISVTVAERDTALLMLLAHDCSGGDGGAAGQNGIAGIGGPGGEGGDSYSWSETERYTDSSGNSQTRSVSHRNSGGSDGRPGRDGRWGDAALAPGAPGALGRFSIQVRAEGSEGGGVTSYPSRYHLRLLDFRHTGSHPDGIYEPGEIVRVSDIVVENVGGMPLPTADEVAVELLLGDWVRPERSERGEAADAAEPGASGRLLCAPGLGAGERQRLEGELRFRLREYEPEEPGPALAVREEIGHRAFIPAVKREFSGFQDEAAREAGRLVVSFPARIASVESLRALAAGEATRVVVKVHNDSAMALGARSSTGRVLRVRVTTAPGSELDDEAVALREGSAELLPSAGFVHDLDVLEAGASAEVEVTLAIRDGAPAYQSFTGQVALELGIWDRPSEPRRIHLQRFEVRVARRFEPSGADVLLVVNHRTGRAAVEAWEQLAARLAAKIAVWDLSREGHFDLERSLGGDLSLAQHFAGKAMVILNNELDGPLGPTRAHAWLRSEQVTRAAATGLDVAFVGQGANLRHLLLAGVEQAPAAVAGEAGVLGEAVATIDSHAAVVEAMRSGLHAATSTCRRSYFLRFWARPSAAWLEKQARRLSRQLDRALPSRRHVVVYRFHPELERASWWWGSRWQVGTLETLQVLDRVGNAVVQVAVDDQQLGEGTYVRTAATTAAVLAMFDFDEQLGRLRTALRDGDTVALPAEQALPAGEATDPRSPAAPALVDAIVDALVADTTEELVAALASETGASNVAEALPRLAALAHGLVPVTPETPAAAAVLRLLSRVWFVARSQRGWWHHLPPWRWLGRAPRLAARVGEHVETLLEIAFGATGPAGLATARAAVEAAVAELQRQHREAHRMGQAGKRKGWALELGRAPLLLPEVTGDSELLTRPEERVVSGEEHDAIFADEAAGEALRQRLVEAAAAERERLGVKLA